AAAQDIFGSILEWNQRSRQANQGSYPRTDAVAQPQHVVVGTVTAVAALAVVIRPLHMHLAMHRHHAPLLVRVELGDPLAFGADHAAPYVPLFFRLATAACRTSLATLSPASRNSYSMAPNSSCSGTSTARSTMRRKASSSFGRSCCMSSSICAWRDAGTGMYLREPAMGASVAQDQGWTCHLLVTYRQRPEFPTQVPAAHPCPVGVRQSLHHAAWRWRRCPVAAACRRCQKPVSGSVSLSVSARSC